MYKPLMHDRSNHETFQIEFNNEPNTESWCMYFWIPTAIHMKKGKMAGQVAHASARLARMMSNKDWDEYLKHEVKIVYKVAKVDDLAKVRNDLLIEYPVEHHTLVYDLTWDEFTVFGIATKRDLSKTKWKLA